MSNVDMNTTYRLQSNRWASLTVIVGGLLMAVLWSIYTNVHGPTSFDENRFVLDRGTLFWGSLLGGLPNLLIVWGLSVLIPRLTGRRTRIGYVLTLSGLVIPAVLDLFVWRALGPPFFVPVVGIGIIILALANRRNAHLQQASFSALMLIGIFQLLAFAMALIPNEISDQFGGYRIYGLFAYLLTGLGWIASGFGFWKTRYPLASSATQK